MGPAPIFSFRPFALAYKVLINSPIKAASVASEVNRCPLKIVLLAITGERLRKSLIRRGAQLPASSDGGFPLQLFRVAKAAKDAVLGVKK